MEFKDHLRFKDTPVTYVKKKKKREEKMRWKQEETSSLTSEPKV
jgi:hypothetical protein